MVKPAKHNHKLKSLSASLIASSVSVFSIKIYSWYQRFFCHTLCPALMFPSPLIRAKVTSHPHLCSCFFISGKEKKAEVSKTCPKCKCMHFYTLLAQLHEGIWVQKHTYMQPQKYRNLEKKWQIMLTVR